MVKMRTNLFSFGLCILVCFGWLVSCQNTQPLPENTPRATFIVPTLDQSGIITLSPDTLATEVQGMKDMANITLENNGQTITMSNYRRFSVFLDDDKYPVRQLQCEPKWIMGYISNGSFRGPDLYPITFETTTVGECTLRNGDFAVKIIVVEPTPVLSGTPLPTSYP